MRTSILNIPPTCNICWISLAIWRNIYWGFMAKYFYDKFLTHIMEEYGIATEKKFFSHSFAWFSCPEKRQKRKSRLKSMLRKDAKQSIEHKANFAYVPGCYWRNGPQWWHGGQKSRLLHKTEPWWGTPWSTKQASMERAPWKDQRSLHLWAALVWRKRSFRWASRMICHPWR